MPSTRTTWALLLAITSLSRPLLADEPKSNAKQRPSAASAQRDEGAGYADPRNAFVLPEIKEQRDFGRRVSALLEKRKFDELNKQYAELIDTKARFKTGEPKLPTFYAGITSGAIKTQAEFPQGLFNLLQEWRKKHPQVLAPQLAEAMVQHNHAWQARGTRYAKDVVPEDAKLFEARVAKTRELLRDMLPGQGKDPHLHVMVIEVGRSSGAPIPKMKEQLEKALAIDPNYLPAYSSLAYSLLPRWYGEPGDLEVFIDESVKRTKKTWGEGLYPLLAMRSNLEGSDLFTKTKIEWKRMQAGFEDLHKRFPDVMTYQNWYCRYALFADDKETAKRLFDEIGERFDRTVWHARVVYDRQRKLVNEGETRPPGQLVLNLATFVYGMHFHPQTELLYTAILRTDLVGWDPESGEASSGIATGKRVPFRFDFSGDGERLAYVTARGEIVVQGALTGEAIAAVQAHKTGLYDLSISSDGSLVAGIVQEGPLAFVLEVGTKALHQFAPGNHPLMSMALSPDGKLLATGNADKKLQIWSLPQGGSVTSVSDFTFMPAALAFSPDGKTLAVGHAAGGAPPKGMISLYDTSTWKKTADVPAHELYVNRLCYSHDGKLLASGCYNGRVKLWEVEGWKLRGELTDHIKPIAGLAFSPDGKKLATTSEDLTTRISETSQPPFKAQTKP